MYFAKGSWGEVQELRQRARQLRAERTAQQSARAQLHALREDLERADDEVEAARLRRTAATAEVPPQYRKCDCIATPFLEGLTVSTIYYFM